MSGHHLVLVGLMGAGKTTVGRRCADDLRRDFVDTDELIVATVHMSVGEIFETMGEARFRDLERTAVADACASPVSLVIACGGGAVLDAENRRRLRDHGFVVWLRALPATLSVRVGDGDDRPLLRGDSSPTATLQALAVRREFAYEDVAHVAVDTDDLSVDEVAQRVLEEFRACNA